jgi:tetratricopeptide (TPR) repeat protein
VRICKQMTHNSMPGREFYEFQGFRFFPLRKEVHFDGEVRVLSATPSRLLLFFVTHSQRPFTLGYLKKTFWGSGVSDSAVRVAVSEVRKALRNGEQILQNGPEGYFLASNVDCTPLQIDAGAPDMMRWNQIRRRIREHISRLEFRKALEEGRKATKTALPAAMTGKLLDLFIEIAIPQMATRGYASQSVANLLNRIVELLKKLGDARIEVLLLQWLFYLVQGSLEMAHGIARECVQFAESGEEALLRVAAWTGLGVTQTHLGKLVEAEQSIENASQRIEGLHKEDYASLYIVEPGVACFCQRGLLWWLRGRPDAALSLVLKARDRAIAFADPLSECHSLVYVAWVHQLRGEVAETRKSAEEAVKLAKRHERRQLALWSSVLAGWAMTHQPEVAEAGIDRMRVSLQQQRDMQSEISRTYFLALLADALHRLGRNTEALKVLAEAMETVNRTKETFFEAEIYRLRGAIISEDGDRFDEAEPLFRRSVRLAKEQRANGLELRAQTDLSRFILNYHHGWSGAQPTCNHPEVAHCECGATLTLR